MFGEEKLDRERDLEAISHEGPGRRTGNVFNLKK